MGGLHNPCSVEVANKRLSVATSSVLMGETHKTLHLEYLLALVGGNFSG